MADKFQLRPFDPSRDKPIEADGGDKMTERTRTVRYPSGRWAVVPSIYFSSDGEPVNFEKESDDFLADLAMRYERSSGLSFPKFDSEREASAFSVARSSGGGATSKPLARSGSKKLLMR